MALYVMGTVDAQETVRDYVCSACWGHLLMMDAGEHDSWIVECHNCEDTPGFVTKRYAEERRSSSLGELREVRRMLRKIGALPAEERRSEQSILKDLGY